jgi:hypothetical protein
MYSDEVNLLREIRDGVLRRSEIGYDFFCKLHRDYYAFSPEVCRLMARSPSLLERVRAHFVGPLTVALHLIRAHTMHGAAGVQLGELLRQRAGAISVDAETLEQARALVAGTQPSGGNAHDRELSQLLSDRAVGSKFVRWALLEPIELTLQQVIALRSGVATSVVGEQFAALAGAWAARMPLTDKWRELSLYDLRGELRFLERTLLPRGEARRALAKRLAAHLSGDARRMVQRRWGGAV